MSLARDLLNSLSENYSVEIQEKKQPEAPISLPEVFIGNFELESFSVALDESNDSELYIDSEKNGVPFSFRFYVENETAMCDVLGFNESKDEGVCKTVKLSKKMLDENNDLLLDANIKHLSVEKINEAINEVLELSEVVKVVTRKKDGKIVKMKVNLSSSDFAKQKKQAKLYYKQHKSRILKSNKIRDKKLDRRGYTSSQLVDINKRRKLKGLPMVDKFGNEV